MAAVLAQQTLEEAFGSWPQLSTDDLAAAFAALPAPQETRESDPCAEELESDVRLAEMHNFRISEFPPIRISEFLIF